MCGDGVQMPSARRNLSVPVDRVAVFAERHRPDDAGAVHLHMHVAIHATDKFRFLPVKRSLRAHSGLASHWSCRHDHYWSALRYCWVPSPLKPFASLDRRPALWANDGPHPPLDDCVHEPCTGPAVAARRAFADNSAAEQGKKGPKVTEFDMYPIVLKLGIRNTPDYACAHLDLVDHVKKHCSTAMQAWAFKNMGSLKQVIDKIWRFENVEHDIFRAREPRVEAIRRAAKEECVCGGEWLTAVTESFMCNHINVRELCCDIMRSLSTGRHESLPVVVLAGANGGEGKSMFLKGLYAVFGKGAVFNVPERGNFPFVDLEKGPKVIFLDEWRFVNKIVSFGTQCLLFDGSRVPVARPKNDGETKGNFNYDGTAPVFVTGKLGDVQALDVAAAGPGGGEAAMVRRRCKVYPYTVRIPKPPSTVTCGCCFSRLLLGQSM